MPGKKGTKLISRKATSGKYHSVRELVFALLEKKPTISKEECEKVVRMEYPKSNFFGKDGKGGHFTWYKHKWNRMKLEAESFNLRDAKPKEEVEDEPSSDESKKGKTGGTKKVEPDAVGKGSSRPKNRRVPVHKKKRAVGIKTRKAPIQREGSPQDNRRDAEDPEVHH